MSWLLERGCMSVFRVLKDVMLRREAKSIRMIVESDEIYVIAGLKGRNNSVRIRRLGRKPTHQKTLRRKEFSTRF